MMDLDAELKKMERAKEVRDAFSAVATEMNAGPEIMLEVCGPIIAASIVVLELPYDKQLEVLDRLAVDIRALIKDTTNMLSKHGYGERHQ